MGDRVRSVRHRCGVRTVWTEQTSPDAAISAVAAEIGRDDVSQLLAFYASSYDAVALSQAFARHFPYIPLAACSSAGEISPMSGIDRGIVVIAFPHEGFKVVSMLLQSVGELDVETTAESVRALRRGLEAPSGASERHFAVSLIDGLANAEERVVSAIDKALDGIALVGGSAGDDLSFDRTSLIYENSVHTDAAILLIVETDFPLRIFKTDNFEPTDVKFVVTASDGESRTVRELNAEPAATEYAMAVGLDPSNLSPMSFASHPLVVRVGGEYFCRSIRRLNPDGSLSFFCAVDSGLVLTLAKPRDVIETTRAELTRVEADLGGVDLVIGFDCVLRRLDAEIRQKRRTVSELYKQYGVVGFETYGEQYRSMHLNQTFTGVAIGFAEAS